MTVLIKKKLLSNTKSDDEIKCWLPIKTSVQIAMVFYWVNYVSDKRKSPNWKFIGWLNTNLL